MPPPVGRPTKCRYRELGEKRLSLRTTALAPMVHRMSPYPAERRNLPVIPSRPYAPWQPFAAARDGAEVGVPGEVDREKRTCGGAAEPKLWTCKSGRSWRAELGERRPERVDQVRPLNVAAPTGEERSFRPVADGCCQAMARAVPPQSGHSKSSVAALRLTLERSLGPACSIFGALADGGAHKAATRRAAAN